MNLEKLKEFVSMRAFLPVFCNIKYTPTTRNKMRGVDGRGKKCDFTPEERQQIKEGFAMLVENIKKKQKK